MAHAPIVIKDTKDFINNPRQEYFEESKNKILGKKGMMIKGYVTEKERIASHLKENEKYLVKSISSVSYTNNKLPVIQPELRYKARTSIERIYEEINKSTNRKLNMKIIDNQLREIHSRKSIKSQESLLRTNKKSKDEKEKTTNEFDFLNDQNNKIDDYLNKLKIQKELENKTKNKNSNIKSINLNNRNKELNYEAKLILEDFHRKTHFNGVRAIANYYSENDSPPRQRKEKNKQAKSMNFEEVNFNEYLNEDYFSTANPDKGSFKLNLNPHLIETKSKLNVDFYSLQYLKQIAKGDSLIKIKEQKDNSEVTASLIQDYKNSFSNNPIEKAKKDSRVSLKENAEVPEENKEKVLLIDNHNHSLGNQISVIANKILNKCNITKEKNENNNKKLKSGEGKLMITNGLSIKEFEKKLGLKPLKH